MPNTNKINYTVIFSVVILALVILAVGFMFYSKGSPTEQKTISSSGVAAIKTMPDLVSVYITIETKEMDAETSKSKNNEISEKVLTSLSDLAGKSNIETQGFNIYPEYDWSDNKQKLTGYRTTNSLKVKLTDFDKIGKVIDSSINAGANRIDYINFELSEEKQSELKKDALEKASKDAREKAESIAKGLNSKLGKIVSVAASDYNYFPIPIYARAEASGLAEVKKAVTDIKPKELEVTANVQVVFEIK